METRCRPEPPQFGFLIEVSLPLCLQTRHQSGAIRSTCKGVTGSHMWTYSPVLWKQTGALRGPLKQRGITLHRGCPLLLLLFDGLHHYPYIVFLCALTGGTVNTTGLGFVFPGPECHANKERFCCGLELLRLICNGLPRWFDICRTQPASQVVIHLTGSHEQTLTSVQTVKGTLT